MDTDAGASPFGHSCLLFSKQEQEDGPIEVLDSIGFYSQPSTTKDPIIKSIKGLLGFNIDLQDGHGVLQQESQRYLNGKGLRGISFPLNEAQFKSLQTNYQNSMQQEELAIAELNAELSAQGLPTNGYTRHLAEKEKAAAEHRKPRLRPFHVTMETTMQGFNSSGSYTCKDRALDFLSDEGIIDEALRKKIVGGQAQHAFPRFHSLRLPPIRLITAGELEECRSSKGQIFHNAVWGKTKLYWASTLAEQGKKSTTNQDYPKLRAILEKMSKRESELYQMIDKPERANEHELNQLKIQLQRVQNLSYLFNNAHLNHGSQFQEHLRKAEEVLNAAALTMEQQQINASFLLRVYTSIEIQNSMVGLFAILLSAALFLAAPAAGLTLGVLSGVGTGLSLYSFYKEECQVAKAKIAYDALPLSSFELS